MRDVVVKGLVVSSVILGLCLCATPAATAGPIDPNIWYEFGFTDPGVLATGGDPADPAGPFLTPSSGTPSVFLDAPPWTFNTAFGGTLTVTDAFTAGDQFEVFDFGVSLGVTSIPIGDVDCGDDPVPCLADPNISKEFFALAPGAHSITIAAVLSPGGLGAGYLLVTPAIPEPASLFLLGLGVSALGLRKRLRSRNRG